MENQLAVLGSGRHYSTQGITYLMATRLLQPANGPKLTAAEICRRIDDEFEFVEFDADAGQDQVRSMIETFVRLKAPKAILDYHEIVRDSAVHVWISDDPSDELAYVSFVAMDNGDVFIGYSSQQHEDRTRSIVKRCQSALGFEWMDQ